MNKSISNRVRCGLAYLQATVFTLLFSNIAWLPYAHASPQGGQVTGGSGSISQSGNQTTINQNSQNMAIDWQSYNLGNNERVQYIQPNSSSISLNRILSNNGSIIQGRIDANGQVILINPHGILFSATSVINVGGIIASSLDMNPTDFMNGNYIFNEVLGTDGKVVNSGIINASVGGNVALLGKQVLNDGLIAAKLGSVNLAAGKGAVLTFDNNGLIGVKITKAILQEEIGVDPAVLNSGTINAEGGRVLLTASVSQDIFSQAVNTNGIDPATSVVVHEDGTFTLGGGADVENTGTIDVSKPANSDTTDPNATPDTNTARIILIGENVTSSGTLKADNANGDGGEIELHANDATALTKNSVTSARSESNGKGGIIRVLGDKVALLNYSSIDVSGADGGGQALVGGDQEGKNRRIRNASFIYLGTHSQITADALNAGDGGKIITFASNTASIHGDLYARGGIDGGDGGFIETSGLIGFEITSIPDASSYVGLGGTWLIDPYDILITNDPPSSNTNINIDLSDPDLFTAFDTAVLSVDSIELSLRGGNDVVVSTGSGGTPGVGTITFDADLDFNGVDNKKLTLSAEDGITFTASSSILDTDLTDRDRIEIELLAKGDITINSTDGITTGGGDFIVGTNDADRTNDPRSFTYTSGSLDTSGKSDGGGRDGGDITINVRNSIKLATIDSQGGTRTTNGDGRNGGDIILNGTDVTVGSINTSGKNARGNNNRGGNAGTISINAIRNGTNTPSITLNGNITATGGTGNNRPDGATRTAQLALISNTTGLVTITHTSDFTAAVNILGDADSTDTLQAADRVNTWTLDGGTELLNTNVTFSSFEVLTGGTGVDTFNISTNFTGTLNGGGSADNFNMMTVGSSVTNINGDAGDDILTAANEANAWDITADDYGTLNTDTTFDSIQILVGNGGVDTFTIGADITGSASGMGSADVFRISSSVTGQLNGNDGADDFRILTNDLSIAAMNGNAGSDRLYAADEVNEWTFTGADIGSINGNKGFNGIENLYGGSDVDTFQLTQNVSGSVNGGSNNDIFNISNANVTGALNGDAGDDDFNINAVMSNANISGGAGIDDFNINATGGITTGTVDGDAGADVFTIAASVGGTLNGGADDDTFHINTGGNLTNTGIINGDGGSDTFNIASVVAGTINGGTSKDFFNINAGNSITGNVYGGDGADEFTIAAAMATGTLHGDAGNDIFIINAGMGGIINGGIDNDEFRISASVTGQLNGNNDIDDFRILTNGIVVAAMNGGLGDDNLYAANEVNEWTFTGTDIGSINGNKGFNGIENLYGGSGIDIFQLTQNVTGSANGGGNNDIFNIGTDVTGALNGDAGDDDFNINAVMSNANISGGAGIDDFNINTGGITTGAVNGDAGADVFTIAASVGGALNGGADDDTFHINTGGNLTNTGIINGDGGSDTFNIASVVAGTINGGTSTDYFNINDGNSITGNVYGGGGADEFTIAAAMVSGTLHGDAGNDIFTINASMGGVINGGNDNDSFNISASAPGQLYGDGGDDTFEILNPSLTIGLIDGGAGNGDKLTAYDEVNYWYVLSNNGGKIFSTAQTNPDAAIGRVTFSNVEDLTGGDNDDYFVFSDGASVDGLVDGGGQITQDVADFSAYTTDFSVTIGQLAGFTDIEKIIGNGAFGTLIGANSKDNTWNITGLNAGEVNGIFFENFYNLTGGNQIDRFIFANNSWINGLINGGDGADTITMTAIGAKTVKLGSGSISDAVLNVDFAETIDANGTSTIIGDDVANDWNIDDVNAGTVIRDTDSFQVSFTGFNKLTGGDDADTFTIDTNGSITGTIDGGAINLSKSATTYNNTLIGRNGTVNDWRITANNAGYLQVEGGGRYVNNFNNIYRLQGGNSRDIFTLSSGVYVTDIDGVGTNNELRIANGRDWTINGENSGYIDNQVDFRTFSNIQNLTGLSGIFRGQDIFVFTFSGSLDGLIDGGGNLNDEVDMSGLAVVDVTLGEDVVNVEHIIGNSPDNSGDSTITAASGDNQWRITGVNTGRINNTVNFEGFNNITGGGNNDTFRFNSGSWVTGQISGGGGVEDTIDITALTVNPTNDDIVVQLGLAQTTDSAVLNVDDMDFINANASANNTLRGDNTVNSWDVAVAQSGYNIGFVSNSTSTTNFTNFHHLVGGDLRDSFAVAEGANAKTISGGDLAFPDDSNDTIDFGAGQTITVGTEIQSDEIGLINIEGVSSTGGTLNARSDVTTTWSVTGANFGTVTDTDGANMTFAGFTTLNGGNGVDDFTVENGGSFNGTMNGNGENDSFTIDTGGSFTGTMNGNANDDTFTVNAGSSFNGTINGNENDDDLNLYLTGVEVGSIIFDGGSDINTLNLLTGNANYMGTYTALAANSGEFVYTETGTYSITYSGTQNVNDNLLANTLTINGTAGDNIISLGGSSFAIEETSPSAFTEQVNYSGKSNLIVKGDVNTQTSGVDTINITENLNFNSLTFTAETVNSKGFSISSTDLIFDSVGTTDLFNTIITNLSVFNSGSIIVSNNGALNIAGLNTSGTVDIGATSVTSSGGLISSGLLKINTGSGNIDLYDPVGNPNQLSGPLDLRGGDIRLNNSVVTDLAYVDAAGTLTIDSTAGITDSGQVRVGGLTTLSSSGDIILDTASNDFSTVNANAANVTIRDVNSIAVDITANGTAEVIAGQRITSGSLNANRVVLTAETGIGTTGTSGISINTQANFLNVHNTSGGVAISNSGSVFVEALNTVGDIDFDVAGNLTIREINADYDTGTLNMTVTGSVFGDPAKSYTSFPADITANNALIFVSNDFGTQARPISVRIKNNFTLFSRQSATYYLGGKPKFLNDQSDIKLKVLDALSGLSGQQLIELETLAEIDPAIFTEVRNYYHEDLAIMMPDDQIYSEEEEERRRKMSER